MVVNEHRGTLVDIGLLGENPAAVVYNEAMEYTVAEVRQYRWR